MNEEQSLEFELRCKRFQDEMNIWADDYAANLGTLFDTYVERVVNELQSTKIRAEERHAESIVVATTNAKMMSASYLRAGLTGCDVNECIAWLDKFGDKLK